MLNTNPERVGQNFLGIDGITTEEGLIPLLTPSVVAAAIGIQTIGQVYPVPELTYLTTSQGVGQIYPNGA
jgi:hypothetical protein